MSSASAHSPPGALCLQAACGAAAGLALAHGPWAAKCQARSVSGTSWEIEAQRGPVCPEPHSNAKVGLVPLRGPTEPELTCLRGGGGELTVGAWLQWTVGRAQRQDKATLCL